jgi:TRAP-type C4-dicarboxylate transport system permease small subunit
VERRRVERFIDGIELTAAAILAVVTANTFIAVLLRYVFSWQIPDSHDFGRLLLGILIFWGIAVTSYRGDHITVDLLWGALPTPLKRATDIFASLVTLACLATLTWMMGDKVWSTYQDNVLTFDLNLPVWGFFFAAWLGLAAAIVLLAVRTVRLMFRPEAVAQRAAVEALE